MQYDSEVEEDEYFLFLLFCSSPYIFYASNGRDDINGFHGEAEGTAYAETVRADGHSAGLRRI